MLMDAKLIDKNIILSIPTISIIYPQWLDDILRNLHKKQLLFFSFETVDELKLFVQKTFEVAK